MPGFESAVMRKNIFRFILERANIRAILGGNLALFVMLSGVVTPGVNAVSTPGINSISALDQPIVTEVAVQYPLLTVIINQGYFFFHPGLDLKGKTGDPVRPIMKGQIVRIEESRFGYGKSVVVDHKNGFASRYAHLSKIKVNLGDEVDTKTVIGEVGSTGHSTGPHLHLEVYKDGRTVNPNTILSKT